MRVTVTYLLEMCAGQNVFNENETIAKYEIMDGAPVRGKYSVYELTLCKFQLHKYCIII